MSVVKVFQIANLTFLSIWVFLLKFVLTQGLSGLEGFNKLYVPAPPGTRPPCAKGVATFCEKVDKYPSELIQTLLRSNSNFGVSDIFTDEREGLDEPPVHFLHQESLRYPNSKLKRKTRSSAPVKGKTTPLAALKAAKTCVTLEKTVEPKVAMNHQGDWRFILKGSRFEVEMCDHKCHVPCIQEFTAVSMMSLSQNGEKLVKDKFFLPTHCRC